MPLLPGPNGSVTEADMPPVTPSVVMPRRLPARAMTPAAWLQVLVAKLDAQVARITEPDAYYEGHHKLRYATEKYRDAFAGVFPSFSDNWCRGVVDAPVERLAIDGFRFEEDQADRDAWLMWQANNLDAESVLAHTEAVKLGSSYVLVEPAPQGLAPLITVEHPAQVVVAHSAASRRQRSAALKRWLGDDGYVYANVYLPEAVYKFRSVKQRTARSGSQRVQYTRRVDDPGFPNPLGVVPIIPLYNNPSLLGGGRSDLETAIPLQDAINKQVVDMLVSSEFQAFRQRVLLGVEIPKDPETGQPLPGSELKAMQSRLWVFANENAKIAEFGETNLANYVASIKELIRHLTAQTRTPPHYFAGEIVNASADALKAAEAGLVARVRLKQLHFSDAWEDVIRLAFLATGDTARASDVQAQTIWRDPENRTMGELVDAQLKLRTLGLPLEMLWERAGFTPQEIERAKRLAGLPDRPPPGATTTDVPPPGGPASTETPPPAA